MDTKTRFDIRRTLLVRGSREVPLLAPRGVWLVDGKLLISDTAQNRVFIWHRIPEDEYAPPDVVLGQEAPEAIGRNAGGAVSASTLLYPSGLWSDGRRLIVADAWNHRVLIWHSFPTRHGQPADVVVGQRDFTTNTPNTGIGSAPTAHTLHWPYGVHSDGTRLWIADTGNRRVLFYETIPEDNYAAAAGVIGKPSMTERDYEPHQPVWPYSVRVSPDGRMAIADTQYYRVLLWKDWRRGLDYQRADVVIGQPDFESCGQNQYLPHPDAHTLNWCYDSFFYGEGLWVVDAGNSRLLWFEPIPEQNNARASFLLGQKDFTMGGEHLESISGAVDCFYWPFAVCIEGCYMAIADTGNHRIVLHEMAASDADKSRL